MRDSQDPWTILGSKGVPRDKVYNRIEEDNLGVVGGKLEGERPIDRIIDFLKKQSLKLKELGVPVNTETGRLDPMMYSSVHSATEISRHQREVDEAKRSIGIPTVNRENARGEQFEILKTAVLQKHLKESFIVVRSSEYDDIKNGVDNVILDKQTGEVIAAIDDVCVDPDNQEDEVLKKKKGKVKATNEGQGACITYNLKIGEDGKPRAAGQQYGVPIFYLAIDPERLNNCVELFKTDESDFDVSEKVLARILAGQINTQIEAFLLPGSKVNQIVRERALRVQDTLHPYITYGRQQVK